MNNQDGKIRVGIVGTGAFAQSFIPLFKAHPLVENIVLCEMNPTKLQENSKKHAIPDTCLSFDELCRKDVDAVAIFTQNWLHGPQAVKALRAGKHTYSAVPASITMEEITDLVKTVKETGKIYMVGETSYYYPCALYCRERFKQGDFGHIVYGEGEYYHDFDGLYKIYQRRGGERWKEFAGHPPMYYPTHSISMIVSVTGAHATHVACMGFVDRHDDGLFRKGVNIWDNEFSNETALMRMSDGSMSRINEFRRIGAGGERLSLFGTNGVYEEQTRGKVWTSKSDRAKGAKPTNLTDFLSCSNVMRKTNGGQTDEALFLDVSRIHPIQRLPKEFAGLHSAHAGSHYFLIDDFVKACVSGEQPPINVWQAARYLVPGLIAHESAKQGGVLLEVPDFGDAPA